MAFDFSNFQRFINDPATLNRLADSPIDPWKVMQQQFPTVGERAGGLAQTPATVGLAGTPAGPRTYGTSAPVNPGAYAAPGVPQNDIGGSLGVGAQGLSMLGQAQQRTPPANAFMMSVGGERKQTFRPWLKTPTPAAQPGVGELLTRRRNG